MGFVCYNGPINFLLSGIVMPMYNNLVVNKSDEFFISVTKQGIHNFIMLGVMNKGAPKLLARVGKTDNIDPDFKEVIKMLRKAVGQGTLARLADEGISRPLKNTVDITYQAYAVNFE